MIDLKKFRKDNNLSQVELAEILEVKQSFISQIENGGSPVPINIINVLKEKYDIKPYVITISNENISNITDKAYLEKDGVLFYIEDATELIAKNPIEAKKDPLYKQHLAKEFLDLIKRSKDDKGVSLNKLLDNIDF